MAGIQIRLATSADADQVIRLRSALWPESSKKDHGRELMPILEGSPVGVLPIVVLVAEVDGTIAGFVEVGLRSYADGCERDQPVGYLEGWYVAIEHRRKGIAARLLAAAEDWARGYGCKQMASDTWIDSDQSQRVHEALGFEVVDRCVHYRKPLIE